MPLLLAKAGAVIFYPRGAGSGDFYVFLGKSGIIIYMVQPPLKKISLSNLTPMLTPMFEKTWVKTSIFRLLVQFEYSKEKSPSSHW